jgi:hypothetical protein
MLEHPRLFNSKPSDQMGHGFHSKTFKSWNSSVASGTICPKKTGAIIHHMISARRFVPPHENSTSQPVFFP